MKKPERHFLLALVFVMTGSLHKAHALDLNHSLERWISDEAGPRLAELYARHPRFDAQTVHFVAVVDGRPSPTSNQLLAAVEQSLSRTLRSQPGVRISVPGDASRCGVTRPSEYLVGIEVRGGGGRHHAINIGVIDTTESIWVSGVSLEWSGALSSTERHALAQPRIAAVPG